MAPEPVIPKPEIDPDFRALAGTWQGRRPRGKGRLFIRFTIQQRNEAFLGNSKMTCNFVTPLMPARDRNDRKLQLQARLNPEAANLTGIVHNGAIEFGIDKVLGKDIHGCEISTFTITPAGAQEIDAAWTERNCSGGHIILRKIRGCFQVPAKTWKNRQNSSEQEGSRGLRAQRADR